MAKKKTRIAAVADIHIKDSDKGKWAGHFKYISEHAEILIIAGDLTDTGDESEAVILSEELKSCKIPVVMVLGNHDYEKNREKLIRQALINENVHILDGEAIIINDIGFAGTKGFGGGFDNHMLSMFGEKAMKEFVQEAVNETLLLDRALARIESERPDIKKIAILHYAPISETVKGEAETIYPFLGSSRLSEPINRREVTAVFHGHAHKGTFKGKTTNGIRVFNVAKHILLKEGYQEPFFIFDVE
ncbi:metallophosphoesterase [Pseudopedobacter saltans DSM 12145]|uniref:Metallophosphoesterase n=1 Tax=Pseudopedobacter saltans (strain ATCC 51119 / DSM 12145 / JCM 21818 / CCUG 39354 / LMG 10337 / NBRC 100064 / NCIMB 13643) TaxID=762903 RepID=F0SDE3_PSESL|nr:metallophosphoesterase [Pseudopedobacter saltans]ADY53926.1 metallophosphoesterase [Pseudopedobacter saltans DSM 12145]